MSKEVNRLLKSYKDLMHRADFCRRAGDLEEEQKARAKALEVAKELRRNDEFASTTDYKKREDLSRKTKMMLIRQKVSVVRFCRRNATKYRNAGDIKKAESLEAREQEAIRDIETLRTVMRGIRTAEGGNL